MAGRVAMNSRVLQKLGLGGVLGCGLLLFCLAFYIGSMVPAEEELASLSGERTRLARDVAQLAAGAASTRDVAPPIAVADLLKRLNLLAEKHGLTVERSAYQLKGEEGARRLEISMPLRVAYPALRAYLRDALALSPGAALDELSLQRTHAGDPALTAQVRLSFAVATAP